MVNNKIRILALAGSLRQGSYNRAALRAIQELLPEDAEMDIYDLASLPFLNEDLENQGMPRKVEDFFAHINLADALIIATPEYNYSIPAVLKNALDWGSRGNAPLRNKTTAILSASSGSFGGARVQYHLRQVCVAINMQVLNRPEVFITFADKKFDAEGKLVDENTRNKLQKLLNALIKSI